MTLIHLALSVLVILINLAAVTLLAARWLPPGVAKAGGLLALTLPLFALEHQIGLGSLNGCWPVFTAASSVVLWRSRARVLQRDFRTAEAIFIGIFAYALLWRFFLPNIDASTERLANLYFIANYLPGDRLPPPDLWLAGPYKFDFYHGFQHYVAALMGRFLALSPGLAMNLAQPLVIAFIGSLAAFALAQFVKPRWPRFLLVAALIAGGNGLTPMLHFFINPPAHTPVQHAETAVTQFWAATRFSGAYEERVNTREGIYFFEQAPINDRNLLKMDLPYETISFYSLLGDYHPPLGGFALLVLALALMAWLIMGACEAPSPRSREVASAVIAATPVLCIVTNVWTLPLQAFLVLCFVCACLLHERSQDLPLMSWRAFATGGLVSLMLIYPFLGSFSLQSFAPTVRPVPEQAATRLSVWIGLHWPALVLATLALVQGRKMPWLWWLAGLTFALLAFSEKLYLDDGSGGAFLRFNTTIKWWSWMLPLVLVGLAGPVFALGGQAARAVVVLVAFALLTNLANVGRYLLHADSPTLGRLAGDGWLRADQAHGELLEWLRNAPSGLVLEGMQGGAYNPTSALSLFAGKAMLLGWPSHQALWRREVSGIWPLNDQIQRFYAGNLPDALGWLRQRNLRYVLWTRWDEAKNPGGSHRIDELIGSRYRFRAFEIRGNSRIGVWELQGAPDFTQMPRGSPLPRPNSFQP
jgi:hypothetical protein